MKTIDISTLHSEAEVTKWYMPVIDALISLGNEAPKTKAIETVLSMCNVTKEQLHPTTKDGEPLLVRTIEFARNDLRVEGIIDGGTRGIWKLTELGERILISRELAGKIRSKSVKLSAIRSKNKKTHGNEPLPQIDLTQYYQYRNALDFSHEINIQKPNLQMKALEIETDEQLVQSIQEIPISCDSLITSHSTNPKEKPAPVLTQGRVSYPRNRQIAINALSMARFKCEINPDHPTFLRRNLDCQYTEPHHLIPMAYQDQFDYSLDVEENIVSLCCTCHKEIHYGANAVSLISSLYEMRNTLLKEAGITVSLDQLIKMYE